MAKRYLLSPVIGNGLTAENSFRPAVHDVPLTNSVSLLPNRPDGVPKYRFAFSLCGTANLAGVLALSNSLVFPDYPLDARLDGMEAAARAAMVQSAEAFDLDGAGLHLSLAAANQDSNSYRQLIQALGSQIEPVFNADTFDVTEPGQ